MEETPHPSPLPPGERGYAGQERGGTKTAAGQSRAQAVGVSGSRRSVGHAFADRLVHGFGCHEDGDADVEGAGGADR